MKAAIGTAVWMFGSGPSVVSLAEKRKNISRVFKRELGVLSKPMVHWNAVCVWPEVQRSGRSHVSPLETLKDTFTNVVSCV